MEYLFNAQSKDQEVVIRQMLRKTIDELRSFPTGQASNRIGFDGVSGAIISDMIDLGSAPGHAPLSDDIRKSVDTHGSVKLQMKSSYAKSLADVIEAGLVRHEHGADNPLAFILH